MDSIVHGVAKSWTRLSDLHFQLNLWNWILKKLSKGTIFKEKFDPHGEGPLPLLKLLGLKLMLSLMPEAEMLTQLLLPEVVQAINQ